jgi:formylglycine-generating enzyme required for sulfatase activity
MVALPQGYCIDATDVTYAQYHSWQSATPSTDLMPSYCTSWKSTYNAGTGSGKLNLPVATVDWCDAYAYCKGVGKRLCGKIGGGANGYGDYASESSSQWFNACSSNGAAAYPYGSTYNGGTCNGFDHGVGATVAVASMPGCESSVSGYTGVYDLSGNVWEWEDSCNGNAGQNDDCRIRGGAFASGSDDLACAGVSEGGRGTANNGIGFRCCAP